MIDELAYEIVSASGAKKTVLGMQVGRFAVRRAPSSFSLRDKTGHELDVSNRWLVDHVPSGCTVAVLQDFSDAVVVADDMSRFSLADPEFKDARESAEAVGNALCRWGAEVSKLGRTELGGYREWLKQVARP